VDFLLDGRWVGRDRAAPFERSLVRGGRIRARTFLVDGRLVTRDGALPRCS
jgi:hypothetical protein